MNYINIARNVGNQEFILKHKPKLGDFALFIAEQNSLSQKARLKLPSFAKNNCIYTVRSFEQCTGEAVADYKASIIKGDKLLILAAGLGVDDFAFSKENGQVLSIDNDEEINLIAIHNFRLLAIHNIERITSTAEDFLKSNTMKFDNVYIDPDRRHETQRQILLSQHQPDVIGLLPELLKISDHIWIKCSPLYDIDMALKEIGTISEIYCISQKGEVKEMLLHAGPSASTDITIACTDIGSNITKVTVFMMADKMPEEAEHIEGYFFEAGSAIVKVRKHHTYASNCQLKLIDRQVPFYIGEKKLTEFIGKCLEIVSSFQYNAKQIKRYLKSNKLSRINIKARGLSLETETLYKKLEVKEGGEEFLFICPYRSKNIVIHCRP